jgi:hypothetical protein
LVAQHRQQVDDALAGVGLRCAAGDRAARQVDVSPGELQRLAQAQAPRT